MTQANDPHALLYGTKLDPAEAQRLTRQLLSSCDDGELYLQFIASEAFGFDDGRLKTADYSRDSGFGLRGVSGEMTGFAHANEISAAAIARAGETLKLLDARLLGAPARRLQVFLRQPRHHAQGAALGVQRAQFARLGRRRIAVVHAALGVQPAVGLRRRRRGDAQQCTGQRGQQDEPHRVTMAPPGGAVKSGTAAVRPGE